MENYIDLPGEVWRDIPGYDGLYQASDEGRIRKLRKNKPPRLLKLTQKNTKDGNGYLVASLRKDGKNKYSSVARLVYTAFHGEISKFDMILHRNRVSLDNHIQNLMLKSRNKNSFGNPGKKVVKLALTIEILDVYPSQSAAGRANYVACSTMGKHCRGEVSRPLAGDGYAYAWDTEEGIAAKIRQIKEWAQKLGIRIESPQDLAYCSELELDGLTSEERALSKELDITARDEAADKKTLARRQRQREYYHRKKEAAASADTENGGHYEHSEKHF